MLWQGAGCDMQKGVWMLLRLPRRLRMAVLQLEQADREREAGVLCVSCWEEGAGQAGPPDP